MSQMPRLSFPVDVSAEQSPRSSSGSESDQRSVQSSKDESSQSKTPSSSPPSQSLHSFSPMQSPTVDEPISSRQPIEPHAPLSTMLRPDLQLNMDKLDGGVSYEEDEQDRREQLMLYDGECSCIFPFLYLGSRTVASTFEILEQNSITHILNLSVKVFPNYFPDQFSYVAVPLNDDPNEDILSFLPYAVHLIETVRLKQGRVFTHCHLGVSRSAAIVIGYVMWYCSVGYEAAFEYVHGIREIVRPNFGFVAQLGEWEKRLSGYKEDSLIRMRPVQQNAVCALPTTILPPWTASSFDPRFSYILWCTDRIYIWHGRDSPNQLRKQTEQYGSSLLNLLMPSNTTLPMSIRPSNPQSAHLHSPIIDSDRSSEFEQPPPNKSPEDSDRILFEPQWSKPDGGLFGPSRVFIQQSPDEFLFWNAINKHQLENTDSETRRDGKDDFDPLKFDSHSIVPQAKFDQEVSSSLGESAWSAEPSVLASQRDSMSCLSDRVHERLFQMSSRGRTDRDRGTLTDRATRFDQLRRWYNTGSIPQTVETEQDIATVRSERDTGVTTSQPIVPPHRAQIPLTDRALPSHTGQIHPLINTRGLTTDSINDSWKVGQNAKPSPQIKFSLNLGNAVDPALDDHNSQAKKADGSMNNREVADSTSSFSETPIARLFEFPTFEELRQFDSQDLWNTKLFILVPMDEIIRSDTRTPRQDDENEQDEDPLRIYIWIGNEFEFSFTDDERDIIEEERSHVKVQHPRFDLTDRSAEPDQEMIQSVVDTTILFLSSMSLFGDEPVSVVPMIELDGDETNQFWDFFQNFETMQTEVSLGLMPLCPQTDVGNAFSLIAIVFYALALVVFIISVISPEQKIILTLKQWFTMMQICGHLMTGVVFFSDLFPRNEQLALCYCYYSAAYQWIRVLLFITALVCTTTGVMILLPCRNTTIKYLHLLVNTVHVVFLVINFLGTGCTGYYQQWITIHSTLAQFFMPFISFLAYFFMLIKVNFRVTKRTVVTKREVLIENEETRDV
ncbi:putative Protein-tyrosine-phosphatase MKP1 [Blattamonas nauphoetae]|uniref:Protein-tyrosine-phosphatase n=1 Tax=Blattamonas nauphoetae TaxID=2049346 RepID=A0ABQ9X2C9_9EUKA|nr:putative Protein-tyrosine-phosphatase MKP1 [Blattamonas nauphoetae]